MYLFADGAGIWDLITSGLLRCMWGWIVMPALQWRPQSCPLVIKSTKMHVEARCQHALDSPTRAVHSTIFQLLASAVQFPTSNSLILCAFVSFQLSLSLCCILLSLKGVLVLSSVLMMGEAVSSVSSLLKKTRCILALNFILISFSYSFEILGHLYVFS